jgi:hypothetical protein
MTKFINIIATIATIRLPFIIRHLTHRFSQAFLVSKAFARVDGLAGAKSKFVLINISFAFLDY